MKDNYNRSKFELRYSQENNKTTQPVAAQWLGSYIPYIQKLT